MKLRRIDILGFKSFRARTALEIADGVTTVVGPNGCGKSNIVDAIRWSIGSQSPKDLRGRAMEDVIFAGSETHKPMGLAEVSLTLENDGKDLPGEWRGVPEVKITRRLYRTGESEYEINGQRVRLRDIHELFLGTGVGAKEAYSIIEQGRIGFIVSARPEERRVLIEEAAGITRYRFQRKTAERRLRQTKDNLTRIHDILGEVERQLGSLERQARKAAQYREFSARARELEISSAVDRRDALYKEYQGNQNKLAELERDRQAVARDQAAIEARVEALRVDLAVADRKLAEATESTYAAKAKRDLLDNNVTYHERELERIRARVEALSGELEEAGSRATRAGVELGESRARFEVLSQDSDELTDLLAAEERRLGEAKGRAQEASRTQQGLTQELTRARGELATSLGRLESAAEEKARLEARLSELLAEAEAQHEAARESDSALAGAIEESERARSLLDDVEERLEAAREREEAALEDLKAAQKQERQLQAALDTMSTRIEALDASVSGGGGYAGSLRAVLKAAERGQIPVPGRPLAERIVVSEEMQAALSVALGSWLDAVLVSSDADAVALVKWAAKSKLPLTVLRDDDLVDGGLDRFGRCVAPIPRKVRDRLVGTHAVEDATEAAELPAVDAHRIHRPEDGIWVVGVSSSSGAEAVLKARRTLEETRQKRDELESSVESSHKDVARAQRRLEESLQLREQLREEVERRHALWTEARRTLMEQENRAALERRNAERSQKETDSIRGRLDRVAELSTGLDDRSEALQVQIEDLEARVDSGEAASTAAESVAAELASKVSDLRVRAATVGEQLESERRSLDRLAREKTEETQRSERLSSERGELRRREVEVARALETDRAKREEAAESHAEAERALVLCRERHNTIVTALREIEAELLVRRKKTDQASDAVRRLELRVERERTDFEHAQLAITERFGITLAEARKSCIQGPFTDELRKELDKVRQRLERLGPVNPAAEEEFEEARERFDFLRTQKADLEAAMADLNAAIKKMDETSRELFTDMYHRVNERFQAVFPKLFRGGKARLELTDPDNMLETGIDIIVQPPGKRLQSMTLMSGGEKALSAVALIFAIFQLRPTPFCVLDEVDAPLDEANVVRFAEQVVEMSDTSQFLIITHNKRTMEAAQTLYGVTMEQPGVSKVVGVRLRDNELDFGGTVA